jgi:hypothetical protein
MARRDETDLRRYDWSRAERGKYVAKAKRSFALVAVSRDVFDAFGSDAAVNEALRVLVDLAPARRKRSKRSSKRAA